MSISKRYAAGYTQCTHFSPTPHAQLKGNLGSSWMDSSATLSNSTRFGLPVDLLTLESECDNKFADSVLYLIVQIAGMTPTDYLHSHCIIRYGWNLLINLNMYMYVVCSFRRTSHYNKVFKKTDRDKDGRISLVVRKQDIRQCITE